MASNSTIANAVGYDHCHIKGATFQKLEVAFTAIELIVSERN